MKSPMTPRRLLSVVTGTCLSAFLVSANADNDRQRDCSVGTLKGSYGYTVTGTLLTGDFAGPFAAVGRLTFDGWGGFENVRTINRNGHILRAAQGLGTYTVNPDCTGVFTFTDGGIVTQSTDIVIDDIGDEVRMVTTSPGTVLNVLARKQFPRRSKD